MPPKVIDDFGIILPVYLRKIDKRNYWNPESNSLEERIIKVADKAFPDDICSLWFVTTDEEFYGVVAAISARRNPRQQDIDFIYLIEEDLETCQIVKKQTREGQCLFVEGLHYNIEIERQQARNLCQRLIELGREPKRCKRNMTQIILEYQEKRGCKAIVETPDRCTCELEPVVEI